MINYPLSVLMLADESRWGLSIQYSVQEQPRGLADAFIVGEDFIAKASVRLILGDNIFYGKGFTILPSSTAIEDGAFVFGYRCNGPGRIWSG